MSHRGVVSEEVVHRMQSSQILCISEVSNASEPKTFCEEPEAMTGERFKPGGSGLRRCLSVFSQPSVGTGLLSGTCTAKPSSQTWGSRQSLASASLARTFDSKAATFPCHTGTRLTKSRVWLREPAGGELQRQVGVLEVFPWSMCYIRLHSKAEETPNIRGRCWSKRGSEKRQVEVRQSGLSLPARVAHQHRRCPTPCLPPFAAR